MMNSPAPRKRWSLARKLWVWLICCLILTPIVLCCGLEEVQEDEVQLASELNEQGFRVPLDYHERNYSQDRILELLGLKRFIPPDKMIMTSIDTMPSQPTLEAMNCIGRASQLTSISGGNARLTDSLVRPLGRLRKLKSLGLGAPIQGVSGLGDKGIQALQPALRTVRFINLNRTAIGNRSIEILSNSAKLEEIHLCGTRVTDLGALRKCPKLREIHCRDSSVTDAGITPAFGPDLYCLDAGNTELGDATLLALRSAETLVELSLPNTKITDAGMRHLAGCPLLMHLDISGTNVSDESLAVLKKLTNLTTLTVTRTRITKEGLKILSDLEDLH